MEYHVPVLLNEVLAYFQPSEGKRYIDATLGDGGHTLELLKSGARVLGLDYHGESLERAKERIEIEGLSPNFIGVLGNFKDIDRIAKENGFEKVNGILFDLGFSSSELEESVGLSFQQEAPLDMRLDKSLGVTASDLVNVLPETQLAKIFWEYSDERYAKKFAREIVKYRKLEKLRTTRQLTDLICSVVPPGYERGRIHPATRVFQALRIAVNDEIENLKLALPWAAHLLLPGGRMLVISFHSLEDKVAKTFGHSVQPQFKELTKKPLTPSENEMRLNIRSRSARMRVFEKYDEENA